MVTTPVDELRSAAVLLRQRAEAATKGPWRREFPAGPSTQIASDAGTVVVPGVAARWRWPRAEDADYISTMDPLVGLALADLLDEVAIGLTNMAGIFHADMLTAAGSTGVRLARLLLGGGS